MNFTYVTASGVEQNYGTAQTTPKMETFENVTTSYSFEESNAMLPVLELPENIINNFSMLKQNVQQAYEEHGTQVITITSSISGEGCSTIAYFLALMLSQSQNGYFSEARQKKIGYDIGNRILPKKKGNVLIIDGNMNKPIIHQLLGVNRSQDLTDLSMFVMTPKSKNSSSKSGYQANLGLFSPGQPNGNYNGLWFSENMRAMMQKFRNQYKYILIDAPSIKRHPETLSIGKLSDGIVLVVKSGETRFEIIEEAKQKLQNAGLNILGVVLNKRKFFMPIGISRRLEFRM